MNGLGERLLRFLGPRHQIQLRRELGRRGRAHEEIVGTPKALRWITNPLVLCGPAARGLAAAGAPRALGTMPATASATAPPAAASRILITLRLAANRPTAPLTLLPKPG